MVLDRVTVKSFVNVQRLPEDEWSVLSRVLTPERATEVRGKGGYMCSLHFIPRGRKSPLKFDHDRILPGASSDRTLSAQKRRKKGVEKTLTELDARKLVQ